MDKLSKYSVDMNKIRHIMRYVVMIVLLIVISFCGLLLCGCTDDTDEQADSVNESASEQVNEAGNTDDSKSSDEDVIAVETPEDVFDSGNADNDSESGKENKSGKTSNKTKNKKSGDPLQNNDSSDEVVELPVIPIED